MIGSIIQDAARILGIQDYFESIEGVGWVIAPNEEAAILIRQPEDGRRTYFEFNLGELSPHNREAMMMIMLSFNYLGEETDGQRVAIVDGGAATVLVADAFNQDLSTDRVVQILSSLFETGPAWRELLNSIASRQGLRSSSIDPAPTGDDKATFV